VEVLRVNMVVGKGKSPVPSLKAGQSKKVKVKTDVAPESKDIIKARIGKAVGMKTLK
jgi:hypothetical protein